jgi:hypothetical protein
LSQTFLWKILQVVRDDGIRSASNCSSDNMSVIFIGNAGERLFQFGWQNNQSFWKSLAHGVNSSLPLPLGVA